MPSTPSPQVRVILSDGQVLRGWLHGWGQFPRAGWMAWVSLPMWADDPGTETVQPREYRVWLTPGQAHPIDGVRYDQVPRYPLRREEQTTQAADRWAWKIQHTPGLAGRPGVSVVHIWDCEEAPREGEELDLFAELEVLRCPGAVACGECGADVALGPLA
ncbi:DUF6233 domain-containing protein [Streptomyces shenzhenensis]|uniref:DUF6233 domain-containing protein n=1 Tax=Streptomyces shenzhenensis TaxID=943815 RepID=UPI00380ACAE5